MAQEMNFPHHHIRSRAPATVAFHPTILFDLLEGSFSWHSNDERLQPQMFAISIYGVALLNGEIFTFVSKFAAFYAANIELWLHKPPTAKNVDGKLCALFIFSQIEFSLSENTKLLWGF